MSLIESALALLAVAVGLLFAARKVGVPYPSMLALSGVCVAMLPGAPRVDIEPNLALTLFVAPAVMDSAFDMPPRVLLRHWLPLTSMAVMLVLVTTAAVAAAGACAGMPLVAAIAMGAIVAPPDAAAAAAVLQQFRMPRRAMTVLQGESLLNDAVALFIFGVAVNEAAGSGGEWIRSIPLLLAAVPGGALLGALLGIVSVYLAVKLAGTLSSIVVQFVATYGAWVLAGRLHLSPIVSVASMAMVVAHHSPSRTAARDRVSANAVWAALVFALNILAFLLLGLQARVVLAGLEGEGLWHAIRFATITLSIVIAVRFAWVMAYGAALRRIRRWLDPQGSSMVVPGVRTGVLVAWCGMRGLVTLAAALALPAQFPARDLIIVTAFVVVLGTLVLQGFTMRLLIGLLGIQQDCSLYEDVARARTRMIEAALRSLDGQEGDAAAALRAEYRAALEVASNPLRPQGPTRYDELRLEAVDCERRVLDDWRRNECIDDDAFHLLEEELDRAELNATIRESIGLRQG